MGEFANDDEKNAVFSAEGVKAETEGKTQPDKQEAKTPDRGEFLKQQAETIRKRVDKNKAKVAENREKISAMKKAENLSREASKVDSDLAANIKEYLQLSDRTDKSPNLPDHQASLAKIAELQAQQGELNTQSEQLRAEEKQLLAEKLGGRSYSGAEISQFENQTDAMEIDIARDEESLQSLEKELQDQK